MTTVVCQVAPSVRRHAGITTARMAFYLLGSIAFVLLSCPLPIASRHDWTRGNIDFSWSIVIQHALSHGWHYGTDILFTYGPLGVLASHPIFVPVGYAAKLALCSTFAAMLAIAAAFHYEKQRFAPWTWLLTIWLLALGTLICPELNVQAAPIFLFLFYLHGRIRGRVSTPAVAILSVLCAMAVCAKLTLFIAVGLVGGFITIDVLLSRRTFPWPIAVMIISGLTAWLATGQSLADMIPFIRGSMQIVAGYKEMAYVDPSLAAVTCLWLLGAGLLLCVVWKTLRAGLPIVIAIAAQLTLAGLVFLFYKHGFVRLDEIHLAWSALDLGLLTLAAGPLIDWRKDRAAWIQLACVAYLVGITGLFAMMPGTPLDLVQRGGAMIGYFNGTSPAQIRYASLEAAERETSPLREIDGTFDVYSYRQSKFVPLSADYHPRPVFQSYEAYTVPLAEMNAAYLRSTQAPQHVLFSVETVDGRFPSLDDGLSWPELFRWYDSRPGLHRGFAILDRRSQPYDLHLTPVMETDLPLGQELKLPDGGGSPLWATIDFPKTHAGSARGLFYRDEPIEIHVVNARGVSGDYRVVPSLTPGGFLLSPLVSETARFQTVERMLKDPNAATSLSPITSLQITGGASAPKTCHVRISTLRLQNPR